MLCREIIDVIEGTYPKEAALAWDNVGLLVGRTEKEVKRIYVALDATDEIIEAASSVLWPLRKRWFPLWRFSSPWPRWS